MVTGLPAAIDRLRSGSSSLTSEAATLAITYNELRSALKDKLGADGYTALMAANHAAVKGAKPPRAPRETSAAVTVARAKPDDSGLPLIKSMNKSEGWTWRRIGEHESRPVTVTVHKGEKNQETYGFNDCGEQYLIMISPEGTEWVEAFADEPAALLREQPLRPSGPPIRFVEWERSERKKQIDRDTYLGDEEQLKRDEAALAKKQAKNNDAPPTLTEAAGVKSTKKKRAKKTALFPLDPVYAEATKAVAQNHPVKPTKATKRRSTK
jgi:hypothetical protein